jgi:excisionase family DNA binding protein
MERENLFTTAEAAKALGVSDARIRQMAYEKKIIGIHMAYRWIFTREAVEAAKALPRIRTGRPPRPGSTYKRRVKKPKEQIET